MKVKQLVLLALIIGAQSLFGMDIAQYVNTDKMNELTNKIPAFLNTYNAILGKIYDGYKSNAIKSYEYIVSQQNDLSPENAHEKLDDISKKIAESVVIPILQNDLANIMLQAAYEVDLEPYTHLLKISKSKLLLEAIKNYAKKANFAENEVQSIANAIGDFSEWLAAFYGTTYKKYIKDQLNDIFISKNAASISGKVRAMLADPEVRASILEGIDTINKNRALILKKLSRYGFDTKKFEGFLDNFYDALFKLNERLNELSY